MKNTLNNGLLPFVTGSDLGGYDAYKAEGKDYFFM